MKTVELVPHDPAWARAFEAERARIIAACAPLVVDVHHIGSTAIPGIPAKSVIDMLPIIGNPDNGEACVEAMAALGYEYLADYGLPERHYFRRGAPRSHQAHMYAADHPDVGRHLRFRDYLRKNAEEAMDYAELKRDLAGRFRHDIARYTDGKSDFCARIERLASA